MNKQQFDVTAEIELLKQKRSDKRRKKYRSRLNDFQAEITAFLHNGASYRLIAEWLQIKKHFKVSHTTIRRFVKNQNKLKEVQHAELSKTESPS